jgi:hypothetical protein
MPEPQPATEPEPEAPDVPATDPKGPELPDQHAGAEPGESSSGAAG